MKDETKMWLDYAAENLSSARILLNSSLFNPCLQNVQQSVEKLLKSLFAEFSYKLIKTHSIAKLRQVLKEQALCVEYIDNIHQKARFENGPETTATIDGVKGRILFG
jgi:HEPN domain-containing protein